MEIMIKMGKNKDAAIGFGVIAVIIAVIVGVVMAVLPGEPKTTQSELEKNEPISSQEKTIQPEIEPSKETKLDTEDLQKLIVGFESYNKSVKILLDMCINVESETDFRLLGLLIAESGDDFLEITSGYGAVRDRLMAEGYGEHPVLGPLMNQSVILVDQMSNCMEVLAWEFGG